MSLDRPGFALSAKGYAYALLPGTYLKTHAPSSSDVRKFILEVVQRPFLSSILPKLSSEDQRDLSLAIVEKLAEAVPLNGQAGDIARIERVVPPGFHRHFYYQVGATAMDRHPNELPKAVAAVEFLRHRSAAAHHLALVGIYWVWPQEAALDSSPEALVANIPAGVAPELSPHYWRALGHLAGHDWHKTDRSLSELTTHLQTFVPRLNPSAQRSFLQGIGQTLFHHLIMTPWVPPAELERFPEAYHESLFEGWGMALGEFGHVFGFPWHGSEGPLWMAATKGLSARSLVSVQQGMAQFDALFEAPASSALKPPRHAR
jgi:hypothetical protein